MSFHKIGQNVLRAILVQIAFTGSLLNHEKHNVSIGLSSHIALAWPINVNRKDFPIVAVAVITPMAMCKRLSWAFVSAARLALYEW